jgi:hypothetical protein
MAFEDFLSRTQVIYKGQRTDVGIGSDGLFAVDHPRCPKLIDQHAKAR